MISKIPRGKTGCNLRRGPAPFVVLHQRFSDPFGSFRFNCVELISFRNSRKALMMLHIVEKQITYELQMHNCTVFKVISELSNFTIEMQCSTRSLRNVLVARSFVNVYFGNAIKIGLFVCNKM